MDTTTRRITVGAVAAAALTLASVALITVTAQPRIVVEPGSVDFGPLDRTTTRLVRVRNEGRAPLTVLTVTSSCGCTSGRLDASVIPARSARALVITFDPAKHGPVPGPARHAVYIRTDDRQTPEIEVEVRAVVLKAQAR